MPFFSDRAVLAPHRGFRAIRVRQIAHDHAIGNVVADADLPALVLERRLDGRPERVADTGLRIRRPCDRYLLYSDRLSLVAEDRPHFYVQPWVSYTRTRRPSGRPGRAGSARLG